jgi:hypothetical protein
VRFFTTASGQASGATCFSSSLAYVPCGDAYADAFVAAALVQMYARCKDVFEKPDMILRTSVVTGHEQNWMVLGFFARYAVGHGVVPSPDTLVSVISAGAQLPSPFVLRKEFEYDLALVILGFTRGWEHVVRWSCIWSLDMCNLDSGETSSGRKEPKFSDRGECCTGLLLPFSWL